MADRIITHRRCSVCKQTKPITEFYPSRQRNSGGFKYECKECNKVYQQTEERREHNCLYMKNRRANDPSYKEYQQVWEKRRPRRKYLPRGPETNLRNRLWGKFKLDIADYYKIVEQQQNCCAICGDPPPYQRLVVDHDHSCCVRATSCGECLRGLLCPRCNAGLGAFKDNETIMLKAIDYLKSYR